MVLPVEAIVTYKTTFRAYGSSPPANKARVGLAAEARPEIDAGKSPKSVVLPVEANVTKERKFVAVEPLSHPPERMPLVALEQLCPAPRFPLTEMSPKSVESPVDAMVIY